MAEKPNYYEVLGVGKTASLEEIKAAFKKIAMKCHPDMLRNKTDAEKQAAAEKFRWANEALEVLTDTTKRVTYDKFGHKGLENIKGSSSQGSSGAPSARKMYTEEDAFSFFEKRAESAKQATTDSKPVMTAEQRADERRKAREAARRGTLATGTTSAQPSATEAFNDVAAKVGDAASRMKEVSLPVEALEKFRDNLKDFLGEIDAAIARARKQGGPDCKP